MHDWKSQPSTSVIIYAESHLMYLILTEVTITYNVAWPFAQMSSPSRGLSFSVMYYFTSLHFHQLQLPSHVNVFLNSIIYVLISFFPILNFSFYPIQMCSQIVGGFGGDSLPAAAMDLFKFGFPQKPVAEKNQHCLYSQQVCLWYPFQPLLQLFIICRDF